jgi:phage repressor protein C with HTH and peptisase S24 domain
LTVTVCNVSTQDERLEELRLAARFPTLAEFARAATIEPGTARQHVNRRSIPADAAPKYIRAARETGATVEWLLYGTGQGPRVAANAPEPVSAQPETVGQAGLILPDSSPPVTQIVPVQIPSGRPDIPVWSAVAAGDEQGTMIMSDDPIDWISRSDRMRGVKNPFAFFVVGDSMEDRFYQGDQAVVNPAMPMRSGADCVFIRQGEDGQLYGLLKRLMRVASDAWRVRQLNPRKDFELSRRLWTKAYPIAETRHRS